MQWIETPGLTPLKTVFPSMTVNKRRGRLPGFKPSRNDILALGRRFWKALPGAHISGEYHPAEGEEGAASQRRSRRPPEKEGSSDPANPESSSN